MSFLLWLSQKFQFAKLIFFVGNCCSYTISFVWHPVFWIVTQGVRPTFSLVRTWNRLAEGQTFGTAGVLSALSDHNSAEFLFTTWSFRADRCQNHICKVRSYSTFHILHFTSDILNKSALQPFFKVDFFFFFGAISLVTRSIGWAPTYLYHQCSNTLQRYKISKTLPSQCACAMETCHISLALPFLLREEKKIILTFKLN